MSIVVEIEVCFATYSGNFFFEVPFSTVSKRRPNVFLVYNRIKQSLVHVCVISRTIIGEASKGSFFFDLVPVVAGSSSGQNAWKTKSAASSSPYS